MKHRLKALIINTGNQLGELHAEADWQSIAAFFESLTEDYLEEMCEAIEKKGFSVVENTPHENH